jgi:hypothetical protein
LTKTRRTSVSATWKISVPAPALIRAPDLRVPRRDDPVVGRRHLLEVLELGEPVHGGLGRHDPRLPGGVVGDLLVDVLLRDGVLRAELLPALRAYPRELEVGLRLRQRGPRLVELLVEVGPVDDRQDLAGLDAVADVGGPLGDVAGRPGVDGRVLEGLDGRRQRDLGRRGARLGDHDPDHRVGGGRRPLAKSAAALRRGRTPAKKMTARASGTMMRRMRAVFILKVGSG